LRGPYAVNVPFPFALMRPPPRSPRFPYTTLFRSLTFNGPFYWNSGTMTGAGLLTTGASSTTTLNGNVSLTDKRWDNYGALNISADRKRTRLNSSHTSISYDAGGVITDA